MINLIVEENKNRHALEELEKDNVEDCKKIEEAQKNEGRVGLVAVLTGFCDNPDSDPPSL